MARIIYRGIIYRRSIIWLIGACIIIGFVSHAQLSQKDENDSPLYDYRASQAAEEFGLAPSGYANSGVEFSSMVTAHLKVENGHGSNSETAAAIKRTSNCDTPETAKCQTSSLGECEPSKKNQRFKVALENKWTNKLTT